jgi:DNA-binding transcriptional regulator YhcF (GntR family)
MDKTIPKYLLVEKKIRQAIRQRIIVEKLPGERVLAKDFGVSYMTLRKAVENLVAAGVLYKIPQLGTFVNHQDKSSLSGKGGTSAKLVDAIQLIAGVTGSSSDKPHQRLAQSPTCHPETNSPAPDPELLAQLMQENQELRRANEILQKVATYFAQVEQDRRLRQ